MLDSDSINSIKMSVENIYFEFDLDMDSSVDEILCKLESLDPHTLLILNQMFVPILLLFNVSNILLRR